MCRADKMFHFTCFNVEDPDDPAVGLVNGEVTIPGNLLRREVFDPVVNQVRVPFPSCDSAAAPLRGAPSAVARCDRSSTYGTAPLPLPWTRSWS